MKNAKLFLTAAAIAPLMLSAGARAQEAAVTAPQAQQAEPAFGDIVVTAQKREESINKVGLTIQAISGDALAKQGVSSVGDLVKLVPALTFANSTYNTPVYTLRGVGFYENSLAAYPAVSVYVDEVPLPFPVLTGQAGLDVERVEVLKGPQGTLFGQNATGGAINYVAAKPTSTFKAGASASYSRFGLFEGQAFVSGPISNTLSARLAVKGATGGAWQKSYTRNDELGDADVLAGRLLVNWDASSRLRFALNLSASQDKSDPQAGQYFALNPQLPVISPALANAPFAPSTPRAADWSAVRRPTGNDRQYQASLRGTYDITDDISLTSITSYVDFKRRQSNDPDGLALESLEFEFNGRVKSFSQELRIANSGGERLRWILGANYEDSKSSEFAFQYAGASTVVSTLGFPAHTNDISLETQIKNYAVFGNTDFDITDKLKVKAGIRYTRSDRDAQTCTLDNGDGYVSAFFTGVSSQVRGTPTPLIPNGGCVTLNGTTFLPGLYVGKLDEDNVSWRVGLDYQVTPEVLLYFNVAKGYKAGSFLFTNASNQDQYKPVTQESVIDYEGGFKAQLLDRKLQLNGAVFYYDYTDKQIRGKLNDPIFGVLDALVNVPKSSIKGAEVSASLRPVDGLTLNAAATYVKTRIDKYTGVKVNGGIQDFKGSTIPFAPEWVLTGAVDYDFPVSSTLKAFVGANASYNSSTYSVIGEDANSKLKSYAILDLRVGIETADGVYSLTVFGKNVTNSYYYTNAPTIYDTQVRYTGRPATYGVTLAARW